MFSEVHSDSQRADRILASIRRKESRPGRGLLKIFFGMAPGVGKTYAMLEAAIQAADKGVEVIIGVAESHGREDTMRLIGRLPRLPMKKTVYRGVEMEEFDLEEALRLKPRLILIDELAHTNVPGLRHKKRYQDVEELLAAGIDVYTTLNVQHLESRADTVHDITAAPVQETVPDSVLAEADCIQLVDIAPDQLRARLREGKVYGAPQASAALDNFFKESNLMALRELALRIMAEKVDHELTEVRTISGDHSIWRSGERLMVAVGPSPFSARLVRWTRRMAYALNAPWIALSVDTGAPLSPEQQQRLDANLELARRLGAEVIVMPGSDFTEKLAVGHHFALVQQEQAQDIILLGGQVNFLLPLFHAPGAQVHHHGTQPEHGRLPLRTAPAQHHTQARQQFPAAERLGQVIVRPGIQGSHLLVLPVPGRQNQNGNLRPFPELRQHFQSGNVRKSQVQNNGIRPFQGRLAQPQLPGFTLPDMVARSGQGQLQQTAYLPFVINNQNIWRNVGHLF